MSGKGSGRRKRKVSREYSANWDRIFNSEAETMRQATHYNCKSDARGYETLAFNQRHLAEVTNVSAQSNDRDISANLTRLQALELINKWNRMSGDAKYSLEG